MTVSKPQFVSSKELNLASLADNNTTVAKEDYGWLHTSMKSNQQDLETTRKELELIRGVLGEIEANLETTGPSRKLRDRMYHMKACKEYSGSRLHMLEERLRQIQMWSNNEDGGEKIPDQVPDEYVYPHTCEHTPVL
ncbi:hypothetical protein F5Y04DRAFT_286116 [Hypomontagnella monticulosa]|nr:hypothetical protein F5Y04DRAFT_286116 [Hypomontagnella monticulosa]